MTTIASVILLGSLSACHPSLYLHGMLESEAQRGRLYHAILNNEIYRAQLLDSIQNNSNTRLFFNMSIKDNQTPNKKGD